MRTLYSTLLHLLLPAVLARLAWRAWHAPGYRERWTERFGGFGGRTMGGERPLWIHAVSVGEVQATLPLVKVLRERHPALPLLFTTTTPTGARRVAELFGGEVTHFFTPFDLPWVIRRFLRLTRPRALVVMETELWPNLFHHCRQDGIPILLANGRLSGRSARGYRRVAALTRQVLEEITAIAAQSHADAERFVALGAPPERVRVTGSIKFDIRMPASLREQAAVLRREFGLERPVWIAASTHEGEEPHILDAHARICRRLPEALLLLVPRHPERFGRVASLCRQRGLEVALRSAGDPCRGTTAVYLGDTMGELPLLYAASDVAFVGGSLVPVGGHNLLEPAALGVPSLTGPHVFNFAEITQLLAEAGGTRRIGDSAALADAVAHWLEDGNDRHQAGERGRRVVEANRGALEAVVGMVEGVVG